MSALAGLFSVPVRPLPQAAPRPTYDEPLPERWRPKRPTPVHERPHGQRLIARLLTAVAAEHGVTLDELVGHRRHASLVRARDHAAALLRWSTSLSYPELGRVLGGRDHTSVIESVRRHERAINGEKPTGKG